MIYQPRIEQSDWSEVTSHGTSFSYTPTSLLQEVYMEFTHLLLSNLIGQNVQAMVQIYLYHGLHSFANALSSRGMFTSS